MASNITPPTRKTLRPFWERAEEDQTSLLNQVRRREGVITMALVISAFLISLIFCVAFFTVEKMEEAAAHTPVDAAGTRDAAAHGSPLNQTLH